MASVAFDTLKFANRLKAAGVPDKQAEAEAEALAEVLDVNLRSLATKEDLNDLKSIYSVTYANWNIVWMAVCTNWNSA